MKLATLLSLLMPLFVLFVVLTAAVSAHSADTLPPKLCCSVSHDSTTTYENEDFDLDACDRMCRQRFGYEPFLADGDELYQDQPYWAYAQCIADCNKTFWREFDRKIRGFPEGR